jgi:5-methylcytosine-specific restriction endonuclease McrBC regulatory subunit McrC
VHETLVPIRWKRAEARSLNSLIPDLVVQRGLRTWIVDAKYKGHFEELDEHRWAELADELRQEHRHDLHQVLAYASVLGAEQVTTVLAYPMRLHTWQALAERNMTFASASVNTETRRLTIALIGLPIQMPGPDLFSYLLECWNSLNPDDEG